MTDPQPPRLKLEARRVAELLPDPINARRHPPRNIDTIRASLRKFGQYKNVVVDQDGVMIAGSGTLLAAGMEGIEWLDVYVFPGTAEEARALGIYDNRTGELAEWDVPVLLETLGGFPEGVLGDLDFTQREMEALLAQVAAGTPGPGGGGDVELGPQPPPITEPGDVWTIGPHRVACGNCRDPQIVDLLLGDTLVNLAFTSPPYAEQRVYDQASEFTPIPPDEYVTWFEPVAGNVKAHLAGDGSWFVNIKPAGHGLDTHLYVFDLVIAHARLWGWHFATEYCWERPGVPKNVTRRFKNQFEPVYQFVLGEWKMRPDAVRHPSASVPIPGGPGVGDTSWANAQGGNGPIMGAKKRPRGVRGMGADPEHPDGAQGTNWAPGLAEAPGLAYPGNRLPTFTSTHTATGHTAAFPVGLPGFFVQAYTDEADAVFDPFAGSMSTILAAHQHKRVGYGIEISPRYVDAGIARLQKVTGIVPARNGTPVDVLALVADDAPAGEPSETVDV